MQETQAELVGKGEGGEPLVVYRSEDLSGATYALSRRSRERVKKRYPDVATAPRVFVAFESAADYGRGFVHHMVVSALTGLSEDRIKALGPIEFWDPVTEEQVA